VAKEAAPKPKAKEVEEEEEPAVEAPKAKHPLEALPKPTLPLDEWKRQYSNNDTPDALKWFWENYNPEEYSLWKVDYKYNDELTQVFMRYVFAYDDISGISVIHTSTSTRTFIILYVLTYLLVLTWSGASSLDLQVYSSFFCGFDMLTML